MRLKIRKGLELSQICRLLPVECGHELFGHITNTSVVYEHGGCSYCWPNLDEPISFHTHPTKDVTAPSDRDIYNFLVRKGSIHIVRCDRFAWILRHTVVSRKVGRKLNSTRYSGFKEWSNSDNYCFDAFFQRALLEFGYRIPKAKDLSTFTTNLRKQIEKLGLEVEIIRVV
ncbi:MAG: hypothetical protein WC919_06110 [Candidatus Paceibacterota bacterium]|jgi:hypothetical protein